MTGDPRSLSQELRDELADILALFVTVADAAGILGVSRSRVVQLADAYDAGRAGLPSVRTPAGHRMFLRYDLEHRLNAATREDTP